jgi:acyl-CoA thioesterase I
MQNPMIENLVQFTHLEKTYSYLPGMSEVTVAALFGLDEVTYREIKDRFDENAREAAQELLEDPSLAERVDRLPFRPRSSCSASATASRTICNRGSR